MLERAGVRLHGIDFGGDGPGVLLVHGLAGHAGEWAETASWLVERCRVVALDARGHGRSERFPEDVSQAAHAADAAHAIEALGLAPAVVVGQSLGSVTGLVLAATRPELVRGLVVAEGIPDAGGDDAAATVSASLGRWPVPFSSREAAREADSRAYWDEWERIACPILVVRAENGTLPADHAEEIVARARRATLGEIPGAGHDLHLEQPAEWRRVLGGFLARLSG